jgi:hypothetical protein
VQPWLHLFVTDVAAERLWVLLAYGQRLIGVALGRSLVDTPASRSNARRSARSLDLKAPSRARYPPHTGASASSTERRCRMAGACEGRLRL